MTSMFHGIGSKSMLLTHWGRVTHICFIKLIIMGSDNGLSPGRHQAIIWTNAEILLIGPLETKFSEILIKIHTFSFKKIHFKMSSGKWRPFSLGLNVLSHRGRVPCICAIELGHPWFRIGLAACLAPSHYLDQFWIIVNWTHGNKLKWNSNQRTTIFKPQKWVRKCLPNDGYFIPTTMF